MAKERSDAMMADLRARGILKDRTPEEEEKLRIAREKYENEGTPWFMIIAVVFGVLAVMAGLGGGLTWVIIKYFG